MITNDLRTQDWRRRQADTAEHSDTTPQRYTLRFVAFIGTLLLMTGLVNGALLMHLRRHATQTVVAVNGVVLDRTTFVQRLELAGGPAILRSMIDDELQLQFARTKGIVPDEKAVAARYATAAQQPDSLRHLQDNHRSPELYKRNLRIELAKTALLTQGVSVTDADISRSSSRPARRKPTKPYNSCMLRFPLRMWPIGTARIRAVRKEA